ncbi:MAG: hypothetical protein R3Y45_01280 [Bacillota bacterium]
MKKTNIKDYFSKNLYIEALNQTKITGFFLIIASVILCSIFPFTSLVSYMQYPLRGESAEIIGVLEGNIALLVLMYISPIFVALNGFGFLSNRKDCDFYHSIPVTRQSIYCSFALAGITWIISAFTIGGLCGLALFSTVPGLYIPIAGSINMIIATILGGLMIYFATLLGISASGNKANQVLLALLIIFMPEVTRLVLLGRVDDISNITNMASVGSSLPFAPIYSLFGYYETDVFFTMQTKLLTIAFAVVYAILAGLVFTKRKSELAGNNAPNKIWQQVYSMAIMSPFILFFVSSFEFSTDIFTYMPTVIAISFVIYLGYQLATMKNHKTAIKSLPYYGLVIAISAVLIISVNLTALVANQISPSAESINYTQFSSTFDIKSQSDNYYTERAKIKVDDDKINEIVATALADTIRTDGLVKYMEDYETVSYYRTYVTINTGIFSFERIIYLTAEEADTIETYYANQTQINDLLLEIPNKEEILVSNIYGAALDTNLLTSQFKETVIDMMYAEIATLSKEDQYKITSYQQNPDIMPVFAATDTSYVASSLEFRVNLTTMGKYESELTTIYITPLMPKTYEYLLNYALNNQSGVDTEGIADFVASIKDNSEIFLTVEVSDSENMVVYFYQTVTSYSSFNIEDCKFLLEKVSEIAESSETSDFENIYSIEIYAETMYDSETVDYDYYYQGVGIEFITSLSDEDLQYFTSLNN